MQSRYQFREITKSGVPQMFSMILKRMEWMDEKGIQQWNAAKYDTIYPLSYYEEKRLNGEVFVLVSKDTKELISAAVLKEQDDRWNDSEPALYLHNFVTRVEAPAPEVPFLRFAEEYRLERRERNISVWTRQRTTLLLPVTTPPRALCPQERVQKAAITAF